MSAIAAAVAAAAVISSFKLSVVAAAAPAAAVAAVCTAAAAESALTKLMSRPLLSPSHGLGLGSVCRWYLWVWGARGLGCCQFARTPSHWQSRWEGLN